MNSMKSVGETTPITELPQLDWEKQNGLVPAIVQDRADGAVLMVGWMDPPALEKTLATGLVSFFSRTRGVPWTKGETSGNTLQMTDMSKDCEGGDTLLVLADPAGPTCSEGGRTCFDGDEKRIVGDVTAAQRRWGLSKQIAQFDESFAEPATQPCETPPANDQNTALKCFTENAVEYMRFAQDDAEEQIEAQLASLVLGGLLLARANGKAISLDRMLQKLLNPTQMRQGASDECAV